MYRTKFLLLSALLIISLLSYAKEKRKYVNDYLYIGADARGIGMSKSVLVSTQDASATYWNPSLLSMNNYNLGLSTMYAQYLGGLSQYNFISLSKRLNNQTSAIGFTFLRMGTDNIPNTIYLLDDNGVPDYNRVTYFSAADYLFQFSFSTRLGDKSDTALVQQSVGVNAKFINRNAASFAKAWGIGIDAAYTMRRPHSSFAVMIKDATTTTTNWDISFTPEQQAILLATENRIVERNSEVAMPTILLGYGYRYDINEKFGLQVETNFTASTDGRRNSIVNFGAVSVDPNLGLEFNYNRKIYLRGGLGNFQNQTDITDTTSKVRTYTPSIGAGVQLGKFSLDYALSKIQNTDAIPYSHFISVSARLNSKTKSPSSAPMLENGKSDININQ